MFAETAIAQQYDFFWSFSTKDVSNGDAFAVYEPGESGSLYLYYTTNGPLDSDLNIGAFLDIHTTGGVIQFTAAETFDFPYTFMGIEVGNRWTAYGSTGTVSPEIINEWGAFQMHLGDGILEANTGSGTFVDEGYNFEADAFLFGRVDFDVVQEGTVRILTNPGRGLVVHSQNPNGSCQGQALNPVFGDACIATRLGPFGPGGGGEGGVPDGDVNGDGQTDLLDVDPFIQLILNNDYLFDADINQDGAVTLLDIEGFIDLILGGPKDPILGDVDCSGEINLLDVSCLRVLLIDSAEPCNLETSDINGDGAIDLLDVIPMIDIVLEQE